MRSYHTPRLLNAGSPRDMVLALQVNAPPFGDRSQKTCGVPSLHVDYQDFGLDPKLWDFLQKMEKTMV